MLIPLVLAISLGDVFISTRQQCLAFDHPVPSASNLSRNFQLIILVGVSLSGADTSHLHTLVVSLS